MAYDDNGRLRSAEELRNNNQGLNNQGLNNQGLEVKSNAGYIVGGLAMLAIVLGVIFMLPHRTDSEAVNGGPATTTGAGATSPAMPTRPAPPAAPGAPATR